MFYKKEIESLEMRQKNLQLQQAMLKLNEQITKPDYNVKEGAFALCNQIKILQNAKQCGTIEFLNV